MTGCRFKSPNLQPDCGLSVPRRQPHFLDPLARAARRSASRRRGQLTALLGSARASTSKPHQAIPGRHLWPRSSYSQRSPPARTIPVVRRSGTVTAGTTAVAAAACISTSRELQQRRVTHQLSSASVGWKTLVQSGSSVGTIADGASDTSATYPGGSPGEKLNS